MTRISNFKPPAELADTLGQLFYTRKATSTQSASATFTDKGRVKEVAPPKPKDPLYLKPVIDWMLANGPAAWRGAQAITIQRAILQDVNNRTFHGDFWTGAPRLNDYVDVSYPAITRGTYGTPDPLDPLDIVNSKCVYGLRSATFPYAESSEWGWPPRPGWSCSTDANRYFIDDWHAQRSSTFYLPSAAAWSSPPPWLIHVSGTIKLQSEESGLRLWFAPVISANSATYQSSALNIGICTGDYWPFLYDLAITLPSKGDGWQHVANFDWLFRGPTLGNWRGATNNRWLNIKFSTRAPCGKYRAANAWARCAIDMNVAVYCPVFLS